MQVSPRTPPRRHAPATALALGALVLVVATACSADPAPERSAPDVDRPSAEPTPLADYDTAAVSVVREAFCERVSDDAVTAALSGPASKARTWGPGDQLPGAGGIGNEFGCSWNAGRVSARAWVFAPPITAERASDLVDEVVGRGCRRLPAAPDLGEPSVGQRCEEGRPFTGIYGLVGDAWVSCEVGGLTGSADADTDLVGEWCVAALEAVRGT